MQASRLPSVISASTCAITCAILLFATSCVSAQSPSSTTSHSTSSPSPSDPIDPNSLSTGNSGLSNGAIAGLSACGGIIFVFCIAATLFVWNRRATRDMPDVQELVLSDGDEAGKQQRKIMAGPLTSRMSDGPYEKPLTPPESVYRPDSAGMRKKWSDASEDLEKGFDGVRGFQRGQDWADMLDRDDEAAMQAAVARVVSGKSY